MSDRLPEVRAVLGKGFAASVAAIGMIVAFAAAVASAGSAWHPAGESVSSLAIDPANRGVLYAGSGSGVYKSIDGGATWSRSSRGIGRPSVLDLALDPTSSRVVYAVTSTGVFKSTDSGTSWNRRLARDDVVRIAVHPSDNRVVYVGAANAVFKSTNGGATWRRSLGFRNGRWALALTIDPTHPATVYVGTGAGVFKSTDAGRHWRVMNRGLVGPTGRDRAEGYVRAVATDPAGSETVYLGTERGFFRSADGGEHWVPAAGRGAPKFVTAFAVGSGNSRVVYAGTYDGLFMSTDGGRSWNDASHGLRRPYVHEHPSVEAVAMDASAPRTVYAAGTRGVFKSVDRGGHWRLASPFALPDARIVAEHCEPARARCFRVVDVGRVVYFELAISKRTLADYFVCVRRIDPNDGGREFCVLYQLGTRFGVWSSLVRYTEQFPQLGAGTYEVTWKMVGDRPLGPALRFALPLR